MAAAWKRRKILPTGKRNRGVNFLPPQNFLFLLLLPISQKERLEKPRLQPPSLLFPLS